MDATAITAISAGHWTFCQSNFEVYSDLTGFFCCDVKYKDIFSVNKNNHQGRLLR